MTEETKEKIELFRKTIEQTEDRQELSDCLDAILQMADIVDAKLMELEAAWESAIRASYD